MLREGKYFDKNEKGGDLLFVSKANISVINVNIKLQHRVF